MQGSHLHPCFELQPGMLLPRRAERAENKNSYIQSPKLSGGIYLTLGASNSFYDFKSVQASARAGAQKQCKAKKQCQLGSLPEAAACQGIELSAR